MKRSMNMDGDHKEPEAEVNRRIAVARASRREVHLLVPLHGVEAIRSEPIVRWQLACTADNAVVAGRDTATTDSAAVTCEDCRFQAVDRSLVTLGKA